MTYDAVKKLTGYDGFVQFELYDEGKYSMKVMYIGPELKPYALVSFVDGKVVELNAKIIGGYQLTDHNKKKIVF